MTDILDENNDMLDRELERLDDLVSKMEKRNCKPTEKEQCENELKTAKETYRQLQEIGELHEKMRPSAIELEKKIRAWNRAKAGRDEAVKVTETAQSKHENLTKQLDARQLAAVQLNEKIMGAESKKLELEAKKEQDEREIRRLEKEVVEYEKQKKTLTTPAATTSSERIASTTGNSKKSTRSSKGTGFVGSVGFWILVGLFGSAVLLGVVGMAVYFGCRKKNNAETKPSRITIKPKIPDQKEEKRAEERLTEEVQAGTLVDESETTTTQSTINGSTGDLFSTSGTITDTEFDNTGSEPFGGASITVGPIGGGSGH